MYIFGFTVTNDVLKLRLFSKTSFEKVKPTIIERHFECILQSAASTEK